ncbi:hypothetical protein K450DRAFT_263624 [Umbelopsis ramanniana AG]|uniref:ENTH domain-containing protein n=1 Tax=Umbelopsis ramanniana AG TaxID=1314678 RepID=A0AAD5E1G6_UMBRA|nr:uncharacterized protein K450DRAFT_263624 [Umbelopsis ramanniana AG]KAI8575037.1 hypothetical protein K450DRAFT_263624 [Umbelopsis ramanniana AG]
MSVPGKGVLRSVKNYAKGYSDMQIKVREATSNDPWGPSGTIMNEIAQATFNNNDFTEIMDMIDKRLNDKGKNWRHVFKSLTLLDYCLHVGSENVVSYAKENMYVVKTLKEFQHIDDNGKDVGANVRQKAKDITNLLSDEVRLRDERNQRAQMRDRMAGVENIMDEVRRNESSTPTYERPGYMDDERDLRRALEESKRLAEEEERARRNGDDDLSKALRESEREAKDKESKERERINRQNEDALFGGSAAPQPETTSNTAFSSFPQQQTFDSNFSQSANPYVQQQQQQWVGNQATGQLELADAFSGSAQNNHVFPQATGFQQQTNPYQQTSYNPYQQQQFTGMPQQPQVTGFGQQPNQQFDVSQQYTGMQSSFQQPQQTGMSSNPFGQFGQTSNQFGSQHSFNDPQQAFASQQNTSFGQQSFDSNNSPYGMQTSTTQQMSTPSFASQGMQPNATGQMASPSQGSPASRAADQKYAKLNALLSTGFVVNREGSDTFGNTGNLRIPVGSGYANSIKWEPANPAEQKNTADLLGLGNDSSASSFGQPASRNPFGQSNNTTQQSWSSPQSGQKSLVELMQEQKQQQANLQPQMTGFGAMQPQATGFGGMQPQSTGFGGMQSTGFGGMQPQSTGFGGMQPQATGFGQPQQQHQQQQQQQPFSPQNAFF